MTNVSRRDFLLGISALSAAAIGRPSFLFGNVNAQSPFEFLVLGDSLVWGQGLEEDQKFYRLTKVWLRDEVFAGQRPVNLNILAHSGSTIQLSSKEQEALLGAERDPNKDLHPEINISFPVINAQLAKARQVYEKPEDVGLIMLSGGIPEVGVSNILNPFRDNIKLSEDISRYCFDHMSSLLTETHQAFPNAKIVVIGYYPIITKHTPMKRIVNDVLELYNWPGWTKPLMNNPMKRILWRRFRGKMIRRSKIWADGSTAELGRAVDVLNKNTGDETAILVVPPFSDTNAYGAKDSYLFKVAKKGFAADPMREVRSDECHPALSELRRDTNLKYRTRVCELASIGHPNEKGSAAIADAVKHALLPLLTKEVSNR
ncbi:MAG: hypothetical protein KF685_00335 [Acidobacteria bacterium]|nr:hypothetical protein [Acidobacteriota bacterium]